MFGPECTLIGPAHFHTSCPDTKCFDFIVASGHISDIFSQGYNERIFMFHTDFIGQTLHNLKYHSVCGGLNGVSGQCLVHIL